MNTLPAPLRALVFLLASTLSAAPAAGESDSPPRGGSPAASLDRSALEERLAEAKRELEGLGQATPLESPAAARRRRAIERRVELLEELLALAADREAFAERREEHVEATRERAPAADALPEPSEGMTAEEFREAYDRLKAELASERQRLETLEGEAAPPSRLGEPDEEARQRYQGRAAAARETAERLEKEVEAAAEGEAREALRAELENARLESRLASGRLELLEDESRFQNEAAPARARALEEARRNVARLQEREQRFAALAGEIGGREQAALAAELEKREQEISEANTPAEKFLAASQHRIAQERARTAALEQRKNELDAAAARLKERVENEKRRLQLLKDIVETVGTGGPAGEALKEAYQRVKAFRRSAERLPAVDQVSESLESHRALQLKLGDTLFTLEDSWRQQMAPALAALPAEERAAFEAKANELREELREAVQSEQSVLDEVIDRETEVQRLGLELGQAMDSVEDFVLPRLFWVRDARPLGVSTASRALEELSVLEAWARRVLSREAGREILKRLTRFQSVAFGAVLFALLPALLLFLRQRLKQFFRRETLFGHRIWSTLWAVASAALLAAYPWLGSTLLANADLPASIGLILATAVRPLSFIVLLWLLNHSFFSRGGLAEAFGMRPETARTIQHTLRTGLLLAAVSLPIWTALRGSPFRLETIPRLVYTAFELALIGPVYLLLRKQSPLVADIAQTGGQGFLSRNAAVFCGIAILIYAGSAVMDILGYRFGAARIALSLLLSVTTVLLLTALHRKLMPAIADTLRRRRRSFTTAPGEAPRDVAPERERQTLRFLQVVFVLLGFFLIAVYWGIDARAFNALDTVAVYSMTVGANKEPISVADIFKFVIILTVTMWVLRNLPGIYEVAVFPRLTLDPGVRYALLTISRYGLFFIGAVMALGAIHLDLGRIGWLMAAVGFGLGFGLQEIFSNFVSGLILLIERPVRVGDIIQVGETLGEVKRINIRATTIQNFDRQEVVLPNKDLITKDVTNWTLADKTTRIILKIGVAYGSDIDRVRGVLQAVAEREPEVLANPQPSILFMSHGESSLDFEIRFFVADPLRRLAVLDRLNTAVNKALAEEGITIPFPQRDLYIKSIADGDLPVGEGALRREPK